MSDKFNLQELENCLDQFVNCVEFREILVKQGIPIDEAGTIRIEWGNMDIVAGHEIPITTTNLECPTSDLEIDFEQEIKALLAQAENEYGLLSALPKPDKLPDGTTRILFRWFIEFLGRILPFELLLCCTPTRCFQC